MFNCSLQIKLVSDMIIGSGEGWGAVIDADVVFDDYGLPYIPGRRVRGILRESFMEVLEMLQQCGLSDHYGLSKNATGINTELIDLFGTYGQKHAKQFQVSNLYLQDYNDVKKNISYLLTNHKELFTKENIRQHFTIVRQQTQIDKNGVAVDNSLRTLRVLRRNLIFEGFLGFAEKKEKKLPLLALAVNNMKHMGTARTRGFGEIKTTLYEKVNEEWKNVLSTRQHELNWEVKHAQA